MKMTYTRTEKFLFAFAVLELGMALLSFGATVYGLIYFTMRVSEFQTMSAQAMVKGNANYSDRPTKFSGSAAALIHIAVKTFYFAMLFFLVEASLAAFVIRIIRWKNLAHLKIWLGITCGVTVLYITDFISTVHSFSFLEDIPLTLGIFIKLPLCIFGYKYMQELNANGSSFNNHV